MLSKNYIHGFFLVLILVLALMPFQNCAPNEGDMFSDMNDAKTVDQFNDQQDHDVPQEPEPAIAEKKSMMDRKMLASVFVDIFGNNTKNLAGYRKLMAEKAIFGGPCSVYDSFKSERGNGTVAGAGGADLESIPCVNSETTSNLAAPIHPAANVLQQAVINRVCVESVDATATWNYIAAQLKENATVTIPSNSNENLKKLFALFYRGKPVPDQNLLDSLSVIVGQPATVQGWKTAVLTTCLSSHWQSL